MQGREIDPEISHIKDTISGAILLISIAALAVVAALLTDVLV